MTRGVLFDIDGTLVDTNYLHTVAWGEAFRVNGYDVPMSTIHSLIGQGSERLINSAIGHDDDAVVDAHSDLYGGHLHALRAFDGAADLLRRTKRAGLQVVLATSASSHEVEHLLRAIDADDAIDHVTGKDDVEASKPEPDIVEAAMSGAGLTAENVVFVGDAVWDVVATQQLGVGCVGVLSGGIAEAALRDAGAIAIYRDVADLLEDFDGSPLGQLAH
ncbi:MAG TPA: HAD family hydrolase [Mycobacteriales bacterium]|nr:HAD family hydrolase [Mycobacteriales bacterium]